MSTHSPDRAERTYRALLRLFPPAFRDRFGDDMTELFRDRRRAARQRGGRAALLMLWIRTLADIVTQAAGERVPLRRAPRRIAAHHPKEGAMGTFLHDLPHAIKALLRQPGFLAVSVLTLALGIGANTAIFTVVHAVLIEPLPYPSPERLLFMGERSKNGGFGGASYPNVEDWRARTRTLEKMAVWTGQSVNLTGRGEPDRVRGAFVTGEFFDIIGLSPLLGRTLAPADDAPGAPRVTVLNYIAWQQRFAGDRGIVGRTLFLNNEPSTVVGVAAPGYWFPFDDCELFLPARHHSQPVTRGTKMFAVLARMNPGIRIEQVRAEMAAIGRSLAEEHPKENAEQVIVAEPMHQLIVRDLRGSLLMLLGAVGFVLLIGCVNLANLLLARGAARQRELAVRAALGATHGRLFAHLLTESLLLASAGGAVGLLIAYWGVPALAAGANAVIPQLGELTIGWPVIAFTCGLSLLTGVIFGTLPSFRLSRTDLQARLRDGARGTDGRGSQRLRSVLVVAEIALSLMLLVGAGLLTRSLIALLSESPGFNPEQVLSLEYRLPTNRYPTGADTWRAHEQMVERVRHVPGITSAALVSALAFSGNGGSSTFRLPDATDGTPATEHRALSNAITPGYFETMGIPVLQGRGCTAEDQANTPRVVMINQHLAQRAWPSGTPVGSRVVLDDGQRTATIVGVVGSTKHRRLSDPLMPQIYACFSQSSGIFATLVARTAVDPMSLERSVKTAIWSVDKDQPVWKVRTLQSLVDTNLAPRRYEMWLMVGTALVALLLAIIGIYGVMSYMVNQRTREIGLRMALGAARGDIARLIVGRALVLTVAGSILGLIGARLVTGVLSSMLFGISASDTVTYSGVALLLMLVALSASYVPARRAMRVDPVRALRAD